MFMSWLRQLASLVPKLIKDSLLVPEKNLRTMFALKFTGQIKIYAKSILKSVHPEKEFV